MRLEYRFILAIGLSCYLVQAADQKETLREQWIALAHDLSLGKIGYFHWLPTDVQANIFSRIHPEPTLDDWYSNNLLCIKNITVHHLIVSFDIKGDRLAYMSSQKEKPGCYKPYWINLTTSDFDSPCELGADIEHVAKEVPRAEWCGDAILFEGEAPGTNGLPQKNLYAVNIFGKCIGSYPCAYVSELAPGDTWKAHKLNSHLVILQCANFRNKYRFYKISDAIKENPRIFSSLPHFRTFSWNPLISQLSVYSHLANEACLLSVGSDSLSYFSKETQAISFESKPYFSQDGTRIYAKSLCELVEFQIFPT